MHIEQAIKQWVDATRDLGFAAALTALDASVGALIAVTERLDPTPEHPGSWKAMAAVAKTIEGMDSAEVVPFRRPMSAAEKRSRAAHPSNFGRSPNV